MLWVTTMTFEAPSIRSYVVCPCRECRAAIQHGITPIVTKSVNWAPELFVRLASNRISICP